MVDSIFTLRALAAEWSALLAVRAITDAWSQHRGELILAVEERGQLHIRLHAPVRCAYRSPMAARARRNSVTVLAAVHGRRIRCVRVAEGDRILIWMLDDGRRLEAHMFGSRANVFQVSTGGEVVDAFRRSAYWVGRRAPAPQPAALPGSIVEFRTRWMPGDLSVARALGRALRIFDRTLVHEVMCRAGVLDGPAASCGGQSLQALFESVQAVSRALRRPAPCICVQGNTFSLFPLAACAGSEMRMFPTVEESLRAWAARALAMKALEAQREPLRKMLAQAAAKAARGARRLRRELEHGSRAQTYAHYGHILMASPPQPPGIRSVVLPDLIRGAGTVTIPLRMSLGTIGNAQRYYRKARKARNARAALKERAVAMEARAAHLAALTESVAAAQSVAAVRAFKVREAATLATLGSQRQLAARLPYRTFRVAPGYEARVGRSARDSDTLLQRHARPFDLWMHARGTTGAHVVLRLPHRTDQPGAEVLEAAAALAAYHSKACGSALVPVIVTPRKFVRKPKGAPPGAVIADRETVLIVKPALPCAEA